MELETRSVTGLEIRQEAGQRPRLVGYAAVFNSPSLPLGGGGFEFIETIRPGAFKRSLEKGQDVKLLIGHQAESVVARSAKGTLVIGEDERGLRFEATLLADTTDTRNLVENVKAGNLDGMSFGFRVPKGGDKWDESQSPARRELLNVDIAEISVTAFPAYPRTELALRSLALAREDSEKAAVRARRLAQLEESLHKS